MARLRINIRRGAGTVIDNAASTATLLLPCDAEGDKQATLKATRIVSGPPFELVDGGGESYDGFPQALNLRVKIKRIQGDNRPALSVQVEVRLRADDGSSGDTDTEIVGLDSPISGE